MNALSLAFNRIIELYQKHERVAAPLVFLSGMTYDSLTVTRIDRLLENVFILSYLILLGMAIVVVGRFRKGKISNKYLQKLEKYLPLIIQFLFGGLLSVYSIFYFRSTSLTVTGFYFFFILAILVMNEVLNDRLMNLNLLIVLYFFVWVSFSVFFVPILLDEIGSWVFYLSSMVSLLPVALVIYLIFYDSLIEDFREILWKGVALICFLLFIVVLYWMNLIPPVPLAMEHGGIYNGVDKKGDEYHLKRLENPWWITSLFWNPQHLKKPGESVYSYVSIFAPVDLETRIRHQWQFYDQEDQKWITTDNLSYKIRGGRDKGYRGYTYKENTKPGSWRINVLTESGRVLGRLSFRLGEISEDQEFDYKTIVR